MTAYHQHLIQHTPVDAPAMTSQQQQTAILCQPAQGGDAPELTATNVTAQETYQQSKWNIYYIFKCFIENSQEKV